MKSSFLLTLLTMAVGLAVQGRIGNAADLGFDAGEEQGLSVVASVHLHNAGTAPIDGIEVRMFVPGNQVGQQVFSTEFIPKPAAVEDDRWTQQCARWRVPRLEPGAHFFALWIARGACSEIKFQLDPLRRSGYTIPLSIRSTYFWGEPAEADAARSYIDRALDLAAYVRATLSQERSGLPFYQAIACPETPRLLAAQLTRLCHANGIPCRTVSGYARASGSEFSIDTAGRTWNEVYFAQAGWVPLLVSDPLELGKRHNDCMVVRTSGYDPAADGPAPAAGSAPPAVGANLVFAHGFWGEVRGGNDNLRIVHRGYVSQTRRFQQDGDLIALFRTLRETSDPARLTAGISQATAGGNPAIGLLEPYLYHPDPKVVDAAAAALGSIRQSRALPVLVDAMGRSPETDKLLAAQAELLTGRTIGPDPAAWREYVKQGER